MCGVVDVIIIYIPLKVGMAGLFTTLPLEKGPLAFIRQVNGDIEEDV